VIQPLGLASPTLPARGPDGRAELSPALMARAVQGYGENGMAIGPTGDQQTYYDFPGAGQMFSSARDLITFAAANLGELPIASALQDFCDMAGPRVKVLFRRKSRRAADPTSGTSSADNVETDRREAGESELARGGWRHIDDATARERPAIGNSHHHRPPIPPIGDAHHGAERQRAMRSGKPARIGSLAARALAAAMRIDRRDADLLGTRLDLARRSDKGPQ